MKDKCLTALFAVALGILVITFSIALPIYGRAFYYMHIESMDLPDKTGYTTEEIREAYDEVLDFLTLPGREFGTGVFAHTEEGRSHFEDCKRLFDLNISAFFISLTAVVVSLVLRSRRVFALAEPFGMSILFTVGASTLGAFAAIALLAALDFDRAFTVFHAIFFPGKGNWLFDPYRDEIILALPQDFFRNCAILIVSSILLLSLGFMAFGVIRKNRKKA